MEPWLRLPEETAAAYGAFEAYRDMGADRSLQAANDKMGRAPSSVSQLKIWSKKYQWQERVREYDVHLTRIRVQESEAAARDAAKQWGEYAEAGMGTYGILLQEIQRRFKDGELNITEMADEDLLKLAIGGANRFKALVEVQMKALGIPQLLRVMHDGELALKHEGEVKTREDDRLMQALLADPDKADLLGQLLEGIPRDDED